MLDAKQFQTLDDLFGIHAFLLPPSPLVRNEDRLAESSRQSTRFMFYSALPI
jgi:hypothetical protein